MGLIDWVLGRPKAEARDHTQNPAIDDVEVVGESYYADAFEALFTRAGRPLGGLIVRDAQLHPDPKNRYDSNAVAVLVDGLQVGHVPAPLAASFQSAAVAHLRSHGRPMSVQSTIWARCDEGQWFARVVLGFAGHVDREWSYVDRPSAEGDKLTQSALGRLTVEAEVAGKIRGYADFESAKPDVTQLKVAGRDEEALQLALLCIPAAERRALVWGLAPTAWPTEEAAKIYRRRKEYDSEASVLERHLAACPPGKQTKAMAQRLTRARELLAGGVAASRVERTPAGAGVGTGRTRAGWHQVSAPDRSGTLVVELGEAAELVEEGAFEEPISRVYTSAGVALGTPLVAMALLRPLSREAHGRTATAVYIGEWAVGVVGAIYADPVRAAVAAAAAQGKVASVRCWVDASASPKWTTRIVLGPYEQVVLGPGDTQSAAEARAAAADGARRREERLAAGGHEEQQQRIRLVRGRDYTEWPDHVKQLQRENRLDEALALLLECIDATEREPQAGHGTPPPFYTWQAAVICRKLGDHDAEVAILERYLAFAASDNASPEMRDRLVKARAKRDRRATS